MATEDDMLLIITIVILFEDCVLLDDIMISLFLFCQWAVFC